MKIYLAGSCSSDKRTMMQHIARHLRKLGHEVYCPFELKIENAWDYSQEVWAQMVFNADIKALDAANLIVMITPGRVSTAGTNWEQGYAYARCKPILVFQHTREAASLMTYCGCSNFYAMDFTDCDDIDSFPEGLAARIALLVKHCLSTDTTKLPTSLVLT